MKISSKYLIMSVLLLPSLTVSGAKPTQTPSQEFKYRAKFVRTYLAGSRLSPAQKNFLKFDKKEGYYLNSYSDGLGRLMSIKLVLSPDPKRIGDPYSDGEIAKKSITFTVLPRLRTGKGVNIGDSPQQVRRKLGSSPMTSQYNYKSKERVYTWKAPIVVKAENRWQNWTYYGIYTFRNEQLWAIKYWAIDKTESRED
jgi:hypothetical protein